MSSLNEVLKVWKNVFANFRYLILALFTAFLFYLLNGLFLNIKNFFTTFELLGELGALKLVLISSFYFVNEINLANAIGIIFLSLFFGVFISLLVYRFRRIDKKDREKIGFLGGIGIFLGLAAPSCVACGIGLLSLLGFSSFLAVLPFGGKEVVFGSLILVAISIFTISRKLYNPVCNINSMEKAERRQLTWKKKQEQSQ